MSCVKQEVLQHLNKLLDFYAPFHGLANSHFSYFFVEDVWRKCIPPKVQDELGSTASQNEFRRLYCKIVEDECPVDFAERHPNLLSFIKTAIDVSILNDESYSKNVLEKRLSRKDALGDCNFKLEDFMSKKKLHEVIISSKVIANLAKMTQSSHIVDIGGGKGYLSSVLTLHYSLKVLGLDSSEVTTCGAVRRSEKVARLWENGIFSQLQPSNKKAKEEILKEHYKQVVTFVKPHTSVEDLLNKNFSEDVEGIVLAGLHTCGDLAPTCLEMFVNNKQIKSIFNVGCCYHLINEKFYCYDFKKRTGCLRETESGGFPLSNYLKSKKYVLQRNARMLAAHSLHRTDPNSEQEELSQTSIFYRAILEHIIRTKKGSEFIGEVGRLSRKSQSFHEYMQKAFKKFDIQMTDSELLDVYSSFLDQKAKLTAFFLLRITLAPVIESIILLDRILYLIENGITDAYLVKLFDLETSPRGFGIIAWKDL